MSRMTAARKMFGKQSCTWRQLWKEKFLSFFLCVNCGPGMEQKPDFRGVLSATRASYQWPCVTSQGAYQNVFQHMLPKQSQAKEANDGLFFISVWSSQIIGTKGISPKPQRLSLQSRTDFRCLSSPLRRTFARSGLGQDNLCISSPLSPFLVKDLSCVLHFVLDMIHFLGMVHIHSEKSDPGEPRKKHHGPL